MKLPTGAILKQGLELNKISFQDLLEKYIKQSFTGYLILTVEGFDGIEEGVVLLKNGNINASFYEYTNHGITVFGDYALPQVMNAASAQNGVIDIISLSPPQVDLITAFQGKALIRKYVKSKDLKKFRGKEFSPVYAKKVLSQVLKKSEPEEDLFKKFGLSELKR